MAGVVVELVTALSGVGWVESVAEELAMDQRSAASVTGPDAALQARSVKRPLSFGHRVAERLGRVQRWLTIGNDGR